jgi:hypothetical protein
MIQKRTKRPQLLTNEKAKKKKERERLDLTVEFGDFFKLLSKQYFIKKKLKLIFIYFLIILIC